MRDFGESRDAPHRRAGLGNDVPEPQNEGRPQRGELRLRLGRDRRRSAGLGQRIRDRRLDRTVDAAESFVFRDRQFAARAIIGVEPLEGEAEQRKRIGALRVADELLGQRRIDGEPIAGPDDAMCGAFNDALELRLRDRRQIEQVAFDGSETRLVLEELIAVRAHRSDDEHPPRRALPGRCNHVSKLMEKGPRLGCDFGVEQFFSLVERQDDSRVGLDLVEHHE